MAPQNDQRERIIKMSRDITNISKKTIFALHRCVTVTWHGERGRATTRLRRARRRVARHDVHSVRNPGAADNEAVFGEANQRVGELVGLFKQLRPEVRGADLHRYGAGPGVAHGGCTRERSTLPLAGVCVTAHGCRPVGWWWCAEQVWTTDFGRSARVRGGRDVPALPQDRSDPVLGRRQCTADGGRRQRGVCLRVCWGAFLSEPGILPLG